MANLYRMFKELLPEAPLLIGEVVAVHQSYCDIALPGGFLIVGRGVGVIGNKVFVRDGLIEGEAPNLTVEIIEI